MCHIHRLGKKKYGGQKTQFCAANDHMIQNIMRLQNTARHDLQLRHVWPSFCFPVGNNPAATVWICVKLYWVFLLRSVLMFGSDWINKDSLHEDLATFMFIAFRLRVKYCGKATQATEARDSVDIIWGYTDTK